MFTNGNYESAESLQTKHRFLHWLYVMISKRPGTVESPGGIHRRRHQKRRKAVKLLPKCCPKQKSPSFREGIFRKAELLFALFRYIVEGSKKSEGFFHYSSSILESCFLVVTGTASQFGEVYFPLRPLCVFDYNENCCQNDVTASGGPLRVEGLDFLDGQPLSFGNFLIGQLAA